MDVPGISRPVLIVLIVVAAVLFLYGAGTALSRVTEHTETQTRTFAAAPTVAISTNGAEVKIVASDRRDVRVTTREQRSLWGGGHVRMRGDAGGLELRDRCHDAPIVEDPCHVSMRLEVPRATSVRVATGTGDVRAENVEGSADLSSGTGDTHVIGVRGPVRVHAETGDVEVVAPAPGISVQTATGDVAIVASRPQTVRAVAATGDIVLVVPDLTYAVNAASDAGDDKVLVHVDDASPRKLEAHSNTGDIIVSTGAP
jgi:Putative adhesin